MQVQPQLFFGAKKSFVCFLIGFLFSFQVQAGEGDLDQFAREGETAATQTEEIFRQTVDWLRFGAARIYDGAQIVARYLTTKDHSELYHQAKIGGGFHQLNWEGLNVDRPDPKTGKTALIYVLETHRTDLAHELAVVHGASLDARDSTPEKWTPLMHTVRFQGDQEFKYLVDHHAQLDLRDAKGRTALFHAVETNSPDKIDYLIGKADLDIQDYLGLTALMVAIQKRNLPIATKLLLGGANHQLVDRSRMTALSHIIRTVDHLEMLHMYLALKGGDVTTFHLPHQGSGPQLPDAIVTLFWDANVSLKQSLEIQIGQDETLRDQTNLSSHELKEHNEKLERAQSEVLKFLLANGIDVAALDTFVESDTIIPSNETQTTHSGPVQKEVAKKDSDRPEEATETVSEDIESYAEVNVSYEGVSGYMKKVLVTLDEHRKQDLKNYIIPPADLEQVIVH